MEEEMITVKLNRTLIQTKANTNKTNTNGNKILMR